MKVTYDQVVAYRLSVNNLLERLPARAYGRAAFAGLQDSGPRDALVGLHARVADCEPDAWADDQLVQAYSPRMAAYVLPADAWDVFTVGRIPTDPALREEYERAADVVCRALATGTQPADRTELRVATATGRVAIRWNASSIVARLVEPPTMDPGEARRELCRRHVHAFGPTTPATFSWWAGLPPEDAQRTWEELAEELVQVEVDGTTGWILAADKPALTAENDLRGVRLLPAPDQRLFGQDPSGIFVGPGERRRPPRRDSFYAHGVLVDGELVGAWARSQGRLRARLARTLTPAQEERLEHEALTLPIPNARMSFELERAV